MWPNTPAPEELVHLQSWMSKAVITPPTSSQKQQFETEAPLYITGSETLTPSERLEVYTSDFWPRCEDSFKEDFPGLLKLWGEERFCEWVQRYVLAVPSQSFTLFHLPSEWIPFLERHYTDKDKDLVLALAQFEWALCTAFFSAEFPAFQPQRYEPERLASLPLLLQPFVHPFSTSVDICSWWMTDFSSKKPRLKQTDSIVYRSQNKVMAEHTTQGFSKFLSLFKKPCTIEEAIQSYSDETGLDQIPNWIQQTVQHGWLYDPSL